MTKTKHVSDSVNEPVSTAFVNGGFVVDEGRDGGVQSKTDHTKLPIQSQSAPNYTTFQKTLQEGKGTFWSLSLEQKAKYVAHNTTVEPYLFLFIIGFAMAAVVSQNLVLEKYCLNVLNFTDDVCQHLKDNSTLEGQAQLLAADFPMYKSVVSTIPSFFIAIFLGSWSDKYGRKMPMIMPCVGTIVSMLLMILNVYFMKEWAPPYLLLPEVPIGMTGGLPSASFAAYSYIVDTTTTATRTVRIAVMQATIMCGAPIGMAVGGIIFSKVGYFPVYICSAVIQMVCFVYAAFVLKETVKSESVSFCHKACAFFDLSNFKEGIKSVIKERPLNRRVYVILLILAMMINILPFMAELNVAFLYVRKKFHWGADTYSYYTTVVLLCNMIGLLVFLPLFTMKLKMSDVIVGIIGATAKVCSELIVALSPEGWILFAACPIILFNGLNSPIVRSMLSKFVTAEEQGKVMAAVGAMEAIMPLIGAAIYTQVYKATLDTFPGAFYVISAVLCIIPVSLFVWISRDIKQKEKVSDAQMNQDEFSVNPSNTDFHTRL